METSVIGILYLVYCYNVFSFLHAYNKLAILQFLAYSIHDRIAYT